MGPWSRMDQIPVRIENFVLVGDLPQRQSVGETQDTITEEIVVLVPKWTCDRVFDSVLERDVSGEDSDGGSVKTE